MNDNETKVHVHHCCKKHGCKYGDSDCPVAYGDAEQVYPCPDCDDYYGDEDDWEICDDFIEYELPSPEPPKRIIKEDVPKESLKAFLKGFLLACLIAILLHIGLAYVIFI